MQLFNSHISNDRKTRIVFYSAVSALFVLMLLSIFPIASQREVSATATESTINLSVSAQQVYMFIRTSPTGVFMKSDDLGINVKTTNYTGYTLGVITKDGQDKLINEELDDCKEQMGYGTDHDKSEKCYIGTLSSAVAESDYKDNTDYNNTWGFKPSKLNSIANTSNFYPAPATKTVLDVTDKPNSTNNQYSLAVGLRLDNTIPDGYYTNGLIISAVANEINYSIKFEDNTGDETVDNLPAIIASSTAATRIQLPSTIPSRKGYTFAKWCLGTVSENGTVCTGVDYLPSTEETPSYFGIDQTADNTNIKLYAVWNTNEYTCYKRFRLQNADGTYPETYEADGSSKVTTGQSCTYQKTIDHYEPQNRTVGNIKENITISLDIPRKEYWIVVEHNEDFIESVTGTGSYLWGAEVPITATVKEGGKFTGWTQTSGDTITFADASAASTTLIMPASNATIYANGSESYSGYFFSNFTAEMCQTLATEDGYSIRDDRDNQDYTVRSIIGQCWMTKNLNIAGGTTLTPEYTNISANYTLPESSEQGFNDGTVEANVINSGIDVCNYSKCLSYYSFKAAAAGNNPSTGSITEDICPKGWKIPSQADYDGVKSSYDNLQTSPLKATFANYYKDSAYVTGQGGYVWTSDVSDADKAYYINFNGGAYLVNDELGKNAGMPVRCIMKTGSITNNTPEPDPTYMQDVTPSVVNRIANSTTVTLIDRRDGKSYNVVKTNGRLWMTENLNLSGGTTLTPNLSNVSSNYTLPSSNYYAFNDNATAAVYNSYSSNCTNSISCFSYYSYVAATAGSNPSSGNASQDICPKGWKLPTKNEYKSLLNNQYSGSTPPISAPFAGVFAGYLSGSYDGGGSTGFYWTSTAEDADYADALVYNSNSAYVNSNFNSKNNGYAVRCVSKN